MTFSDNNSAPGASKTILDIKLLGQAIIELNIARKNFSIYPPGHAQLNRSIDRAHGVLKRLLEMTPEVTIGVARDRLFINEQYMDLKNPVFKDFSVALYTRDIAAVSFTADLSLDDIHRFCGILTRDTYEIRETGGIGRALRDAAVTGIGVQPIDYSGLHLTEEAEILTDGKGGRPEQALEAWRSFVIHLLSGQLDQHGQLEHLVERQKITPGQLAEMLNRGILDFKTALDSYETTISKHISETTGNQPLGSFVSLIESLSPQLRSQFLSATFDSVSEKGDEGLLNHFPNGVVLEMLQQASDEGKEISPTLIALLQKISQLEVHSPAKPSGIASSPPTGSDPPSLSREQMRSLFSREAYETYVDDDYQALLTSLITGGPKPNVGQESPPLPDTLAALLNSGIQDEPPEELARFEVEIDEHFSQMLLALMDRSSTPEDYQVFSGELVSSVAQHLGRGDFELCLTLLQTLRKHVRTIGQPFRQLAEDSLAALGAPAIVSAAVSAFEATSGDRRELAHSFLAQIGAHNIPHLIDLYASEAYPSPRSHLQEILVESSDEALEEVHNRFGSAPPHVLRNLLLLVQRIGNPLSAGHVRPLLNHGNRQVAMDALSTLLELNDPESPFHLRRMMASSVGDDYLRCVALAGYFRVSEVSDELAGRIKTLLITSSALRNNEEILKSLSRIGDTRVIPMLEKVAGTSGTFSPRRLRQLKLTLFESLFGYPAESLAGLARIGRKSRDSRVRALCARLGSQN